MFPFFVVVKSVQKIAEEGASWQPFFPVSEKKLTHF